MKKAENKKSLEEFKNEVILDDEQMLKIKGGGNEDREDILIEE
jgi:hypothetical protein